MTNEELKQAIEYCRSVLRNSAPGELLIPIFQKQLEGLLDCQLKRAAANDSTDGARDGK